MISILTLETGQGIEKEDARAGAASGGAVCTAASRAGAAGRGQSGVGAVQAGV